jgi:hypothetical protein
MAAATVTPSAAVMSAAAKVRMRVEVRVEMRVRVWMRVRGDGRLWPRAASGRATTGHAVTRRAAPCCAVCIAAPRPNEKKVSSS